MNDQQPQGAGDPADAAARTLDEGLTNVDGNLVEGIAEKLVVPPEEAAAKAEAVAAKLESRNHALREGGAGAQQAARRGAEAQPGRDRDI